MITACNIAALALLIGVPGTDNTERAILEGDQIMIAIGVPCHLIDEARRDKYLREGYTPLTFSTDVERQKHKHDWNSVLDKLDRALAKHGKRGIGDGDFFLDSDVIDDRFQCLEISRERVITKQLLMAVHDVVASCEQPYSIDICDSWVFLKTRTGDPYFHFNIFVERNRILIFTESQLLLARLGLSNVPALREEP